MWKNHYNTSSQLLVAQAYPMYFGTTINFRTSRLVPSKVYYRTCQKEHISQRPEKEPENTASKHALAQKAVNPSSKLGVLKDARN